METKDKKMQITTNAKIAFAELTSFLKSEQKSPAKEVEPRPQPEITTKMESNKNIQKTPIPQPAPEPKAVSIISANTEVKGNISTKGNLEITGRIEGNVIVSGKVTIIGSIKGNIDAEELVVKKGGVDSQTIKIKKTVTIEEGSEVSGNIQCESAVINAKVTGNMAVCFKCELQSHSNIQGDIQAKELSVQTGAILNGKINITPEAVTNTLMQKDA